MTKNNYMSFDKGRTVYMNGEYVPESEAKISIFDSLTLSVKAKF